MDMGYMLNARLVRQSEATLKEADPQTKVAEIQ
jgi:hypothetical protein